MVITDFNIRAYGLILYNGHILVADEKRGELEFTKFPGGGLEPGEGLADCLIRECLEETGREIRIVEQFYTTDFFLTSAFNKRQQLISVYFFASFVDPPMEALTSPEEGLSLRWVPLETLSEDDFLFPVDKHVVRMLNDMTEEPLYLN